MSKWICCGALALTLGVGVAATTWLTMKRTTPVVVANVQPPSMPTPCQPQTPTFEEMLAAALDQATPNTPTPRGEVALDNEPIVTQPEQLFTPPTVVGPILESAGLKETSATTTTGPHPDPETRRMPYADGRDVPPAHAPFDWSFLARLFASPMPRQADGAEESAEPPTVTSPTSEYHHPPHCPYGSHCPYPYATPRYSPR